MANVIYECAVNRSHPKREHASAPSVAPICCGKPMVVISAAASPKPQGATQAPPAKGPGPGAPGTPKR